jgi:hypothetical protein
MRIAPLPHRREIAQRRERELHHFIEPCGGLFLVSLKADLRALHRHT